jgi:hypothetical protein
MAPVPHACAVVPSCARVTVKASLDLAETRTISEGCAPGVAGERVARKYWLLPGLGKSAPAPDATLIVVETLDIAVANVVEAALAQRI